MATKTITIDIEAYNRLKAVQKANESFSQTIKRVVWDPGAFDRALAEFRRHPLSDEAVEAVEQVIAARRPQVKQEPKARRRRARGAA